MSQFNVRPFAFMRLTHEALREGILALQAHADDGDLAAVNDEYVRLRAVIDIHAAQEEGRFFPLLDELFDGAVAKAGLREAHEREESHQAAFEGALAVRDVRAVREALAAWAVSFEAHLADEEAVMMPLTQRVAPTLEGRAAAVRTLLEVDWDGLRTHHLPYVVRTLAATRPFGPTRMFIAALQLAAGERYGELAPVVEDALPAALRDQLSALGHLPGRAA